ncbi:hypothetical protein V6N13_032419 [Hibiscus sabdariffa]
MVSVRKFEYRYGLQMVSVRMLEYIYGLQFDTPGSFWKPWFQYRKVGTGCLEVSFMIPNHLLAVGDRWGCFGAVETLFPFIKAVLMHSAYRYGLEYRYGLQMVSVRKFEYRYGLQMVSESGYQYGPSENTILAI